MNFTMDFPLYSSESPSSSSSSSSSPSRPIHHASFVDPSSHHPALMQMLELEMSESVIQYVVDRVAETVDYALNIPSPTFTRGRASSRNHPEFTEFATNVVKRSETTIPVLLTSLVYMDRAKRHLQIAHNEWALERVFLGALILASKYLNDSTLKNVHWATCTGVFGKRDIGRVEREFLDVLDFDLSIREADLLVHYSGLSALVSRARSPSPQTRNVRPRYRHHARSSMPALEPSSPSSSDDAPSPRTPSQDEFSPPSLPKGKRSVAHGIVRSIPISIPGMGRVF